MKTGKEPKDSKPNRRDGTFAGLLAAVRAHGAEGAGWKGSGSSGGGSGGWQSSHKRPQHVQERPQGTSFGSLHPKVSQHASLGSKVVPDKLPDMDNEGRPFNVKLVVINFANVGAAYGKLFNKDKYLFNWEGVRRCVKELVSRNFKIIGVTFQSLEAWDGDEWVHGTPQDIRSLCESIQETPRISATNQKSADDEVTIKCAYRRNCCILDNDNYKDWHQLLRDSKIREWYDFSRDRIHMRYFFDAQAGWFDTLDGNALRGASEEREEKPKKWRNRRSGPRVEQLQDGAGPGMLCVTPPEARRDPRELRGASPPGPSAPLASSVMVPTETGFRKHKGPTITMPSMLSSSANPDAVDLTAEPRLSRTPASGINTLTAGWTPLCTAAQQGKVQSVAKLLEAGADPNLPNCIGAHPVFYALCNWSLRMFRLLEKHGANLDRARSEKGETLKAYAERKVRQADQMKRFGASCFASASRQELLRAVGALKAAQAALTALSASSRAKRRRLGGVGTQASSARSTSRSLFVIPVHGDPYGGLNNKSRIDLTEADSDTDVPEMPVEELDATGKAAEAAEVSEADGAANGSAAGLDDHDHSDIQDDQDLAALLGAALNEDHEEENMAAELEEYPPPDDDGLRSHDMTEN